MRRAAWPLMVAVLLVGCATEEPVDDRTVDATAQAPSVTSSPSPTVNPRRLPEAPDAMSEPTSAGAIATATYVLELYSYAFASGDVAPWRSITASTCEFCDGVAEAVNGMVHEQHSSTGSWFTVRESKAAEISEDEWFSVDLTADQTPSRRVDRHGATVAENPGGRFRVVFALSWSSDGWRVQQMGFERLDETTEPTS